LQLQSLLATRAVLDELYLHSPDPFIASWIEDDHRSRIFLNDLEILVECYRLAMPVAVFDIGGPVFGVVTVETSLGCI
jgi:hypothetical protein